MGRPPVPDDEKKKPYPMRFSDAELASFEKKAKAEGITVRAWINATLTKAAK